MLSSLIKLILVAREAVNADDLPFAKTLIVSSLFECWDFHVQQIARHEEPDFSEASLRIPTIGKTHKYCEIRCCSFEFWLLFIRPHLYSHIQWSSL